jgi:hypothetical protein
MSKSTSCEVVRFPADRTRPAANEPAAKLADHGPAPEESVRMMRAFVGIKDRKLRAELIQVLEDAFHTQSFAPQLGKD